MDKEIQLVKEYTLILNKGKKNAKISRILEELLSDHRSIIAKQIQQNHFII